MFMAYFWYLTVHVWLCQLYGCLDGQVWGESLVGMQLHCTSIFALWQLYGFLDSCSYTHSHNLKACQTTLCKHLTVMTKHSGPKTHRHGRLIEVVPVIMSLSSLNVNLVST